MSIEERKKIINEMRKENQRKYGAYKKVFTDNSSPFRSEVAASQVDGQQMVDLVNLQTQL